LEVDKQAADHSGFASASLPATATNWPSPPSLSPGTNRFSVNYASNNFPGISFSIPADNASLSVSNWVTRFDLLTTATSVFVVNAAPPPVQLASPRLVGTNFQFSFVSQAGFTHTVQYRTNLVAGNWQTYTNISGDGSLKTLPVPLVRFSPANQGFIRV